MQHRVLHMHGAFPNRKLKRVFCDSIRIESLEYRVQSIALDDGSFFINPGSADSNECTASTVAQFFSGFFASDLSDSSDLSGLSPSPSSVASIPLQSVHTWILDTRYLGTWYLVLGTWYLGTWVPRLFLQLFNKVSKRVKVWGKKADNAMYSASRQHVIKIKTWTAG